MPNIGPLEIAIVVIIALVIFGPKRLPELGRSAGRGIREFRGTVTGDGLLGDKGDDDKPAAGKGTTESKSAEV
jgi:sec-independent protein translocase protein TatA